MGNPGGPYDAPLFIRADILPAGAGYCRASDREGLADHETVECVEACRRSKCALTDTSRATDERRFIPIFACRHWQDACPFVCSKEGRHESDQHSEKQELPKNHDGSRSGVRPDHRQLTRLRAARRRWRARGGRCRRTRRRRYGRWTRDGWWTCDGWWTPDGRWTPYERWTGGRRGTPDGRRPTGRKPSPGRRWTADGRRTAARDTAIRPEGRRTPAFQSQRSE